MKIKKIRDVKTPTRGTPDSAGVDLYIPKDYTTKPIDIEPGESLFIPSGIKAHVPTGHAWIAMNKSGVAVKQGLTVGAQVVDADYDGEIHIHVFNASDRVQKIEPEQKIIQMLLIPVNFEPVELVEELPTRNTARGEGGFGSTGLK
jgi:dUTP pyrophosphatase